MIEFSYDEEVRACYITVDGEDGAIVDRTKVVSESPMINLDYREDGSLYGIEILLPDNNK